MRISIPSEDAATLAVLARSRTAPAHHVERAAIILQLAEGRRPSKIAVALGIDRQRVTRCARRALAVGALGALDDLPRSGRPPEITEAARLWLVGQACRQPKHLGYPHELWTSAFWPPMPAPEAPRQVMAHSPTCRRAQYATS